MLDAYVDISIPTHSLEDHIFERQLLDQTNVYLLLMCSGTNPQECYPFNGTVSPKL